MVFNMHQLFRSLGVLMAVFFGLWLGTVQAAQVGYYEMCDGQGRAWAVTPISNAGHTPVYLADLSTADLNGLDVLFVTNCNNTAYGTEYLSRMADISSAISNDGLVLIVHDRKVSAASQILPGGADIQTVREPARDIDVVDTGTVLTNGPGGQLGDTSMDQARNSEHGYTQAASLPASARVILTRPDHTKAIVYSYKHGLGSVVYSSIPLDYYAGILPVCARYSTSDPIFGACQNIATVYAPNVVAYGVELASSTPIANAGIDQSVNEGESVSLDGSASNNPGGGDISYAWTQIAPASPVVSLGGATTASPVFVAAYGDDNIIYTFQLVVTNASGTASDPDTVDITVKNTNNPPVADAGDDYSIKAGATSVLDGSSSYDPDNDTPLLYNWTQLSGPGVSLTNADTAQPGFVVPTEVGETLVFELSVSDGKETSIASSVTVSIADNAAPVANAGVDVTKDEGSIVVLNALASQDPDGDGLEFEWKQISGPAITLDNTGSPTPSFTAPAVAMGGLAASFEVSVIDTDPLNPKTASDQVTVNLRNINDPPACDLAQPSVASMWPPNHKMRQVLINGVTDSDTTYKDVAIVITAITQDEPVAGRGSGHSSPDGIVQAQLPSDVALLRAERKRHDNGRVYQISFTASDGFETCAGFVKVSVLQSRKGERYLECEDDDDMTENRAHDRHGDRDHKKHRGHKRKKHCVVKYKQAVAIDDGQQYDSTVELEHRKHRRHDLKQRIKQKLKAMKNKRTEHKKRKHKKHNDEFVRRH